MPTADLPVIRRALQLVRTQRDQLRSQEGALDMASAEIAAATADSAWRVRDAIEQVLTPSDGWTRNPDRDLRAWDLLEQLALQAIDAEEASAAEKLPF